MFAVFRVEGTDITTIGLVLENTYANVRSVQKREERVEVQVEEVQVHPQLLVLYSKTPTGMFAVLRVVGADITTVGLVLEAIYTNVGSTQKLSLDISLCG